MIWKKGAPGALVKKWPRDSHDVGSGMLIPWLKTVRKMDTVGSRNGEWKFGKNPIYSCRAHNATSFVPAATMSSREDQEVIERFREHEASVSQHARFRLVV
jgi:hypothetical protein